MRHWQSRLERSVLCLALVQISAACGKQDEVPVQHAGASEAKPPDIERDPLLLLPRDAIGLFRLDARALFQSPRGSDLLERVAGRWPWPDTLKFLPERDLKEIYLGLYSLQGLDAVGIAVGSFSADAVASAAARKDQSPAGDVIVTSQYTGRTLYTTANVGFTVLSKNLALFGNEVGMRRALDRISDGRLRDDVQPWIRELFLTKEASLALAFDLSGLPEPSPFEARLPWLRGLRQAQVIGNFLDPGLNLAGTLAYADAEGATRGEAGLTGLRDQLSALTFVTSFLGVGSPLSQFSTRVVGKQTEFLAAFDSKRLMALVDRLSTGARKPPSEP